MEDPQESIGFPVNQNTAYMKTIALISLFLLLQACGEDEKRGASQEQMSGNENNGKRTETVERLDSASAPLYPAQKVAQAEDFEVTLLNGDVFRMSDQKGNVVLMNIWATWCPPCREETPDLVDLYNKYKDKGLVILGVSVDEQGESVVRPFMKKYEVNYPMYIDKADTVLDKYGPTMGIPTTYIIGKQSNVRYFAVGALTKKELEPRIQELLGEDG